MADITAATDEMLAVVTAAWNVAPAVAGVGTVPLLIEFRDGNTEPKNANVWARVTIRHSEADSFAYGKKYKNEGTLYFNIFVRPSNYAASMAEALAKLIIPALRTHTGNVRFSRVRPQEMGLVNNWRQVNVLASFEYFERNY